MAARPQLRAALALEAEDSAEAEAHEGEAQLEARIELLQVALLVGYGAMCALSVLLLAYMRVNRSAAFKGDSSAARKLILPAFEPLLWLLGATTAAYSLFFALALASRCYHEALPRVATEAFYAGRQFVLLLVLVFMMQQSVSKPALLRAAAITLLLSTYTVPIVWYVSSFDDEELIYAVTTAARALLLLLYTYVLVRPPSRASKRVLREYCLFAYGYFALLFAYNEMFHQGRAELGFRLTYANVSFGAFCPLVIWRVLRADTEYWRGLGQRACRLQTLFRQQQLQQQQQHQDQRKHRSRGKRRRKQPWLDEHISSEGLHDLIEMHRRYLIDFAYLELRQRIGVGASAVVFRGLLRSKTPVAVKVYTPLKYDEATVAAFSHEAALCGGLNRHPNIVRFYGLCVSPPTICLVSELCLGSLEEVSRTMNQAWQKRRKHRNVNAGEDEKGIENRQWLLLSLCQMLDAARAVAYLHSFSPPFLHRDVKPANFLVDTNGTVKLTDFGEARALPRARMEATGTQRVPGNYQDLPPDNDEQEMSDWITDSEIRERSGSATSPFHDGVAFRPTFYEAIHKTSPRMTVRGTVDYMAPEVINGRSGLAIYGEAADVYSLAITMWDILYPGREKYPTLRQNHLQIFEFVTEGRRPTLPVHSELEGDEEVWVPNSLCNLIESGWHADPRLRPSAQSIVHALEVLQEEVQSMFIPDLRAQLSPLDASMEKESGARAMESSMTLPSTVNTSTSTSPLAVTIATSSISITIPSAAFANSRRPVAYTGKYIAQRMVECGYALTSVEAVRLGNALMDAGFLHHTKHSTSFENLPRESYYIDDAKLYQLCQTSTQTEQLESIAMLAPPYPSSSVFAASEDEDWTLSIESSGSSSSSIAKNSNRGRPPQHYQTIPSQCACQKLGQRLDVVKIMKRRRKKFQWQRRTRSHSSSATAKDAPPASQLSINAPFRNEEDLAEFDSYVDVANDQAGDGGTC